MPAPGLDVFLPLLPARGLPGWRTGIQAKCHIPRLCAAQDHILTGSFFCGIIMRKISAPLALLLVLSSNLWTMVYPANPVSDTAYERQCAEVAAQGAALDEHSRLWKLFDISWQYVMTEFPEWATSVGYPGQNGRWTDMSRQAIARRKREV